MRAATVADAWTVAELRSLPDWCLQRFADALNAIEAGTQPWPHSIIEAWVSLIPKAEASLLPQLQCPIVLLAMVLRVWSSTRGQKLLRPLSAIVPEALRGGVKAWAASDIFVHISALIEET